MNQTSGRSRSGLRTFVAGLFAAVLTLTIVAFLAAGWVWFSFNRQGPPAADGETTMVILRSGAGLSEIGSALEREGVIRFSAVFSAVAQVLGAARELKAGEYEFEDGAPMAVVLDKIRRGDVVRHFVTIPEGVTSEMAVEILMAEEILTGSTPIPPEGGILPETYEIVRGEDRGVVMSRMMTARDELLERLWTQRAPNLPFDTPEEAVILASIVEKETALAEERPRIARVFVNRLERGMRMESDPTIIYGLTRGRPLGRGIRRSELERVTPYNTYFVDGLPPTPIANPGREALAAVLAPPPGDDLFFVADGSGGHVFAETFSEHSANVAQWRQIEAEKADQAAEEE